MQKTGKINEQDLEIQGKMTKCWDQILPVDFGQTKILKKTLASSLLRIYGSPNIMQKIRKKGIRITSETYVKVNSELLVKAYYN